eukprot:TRINITY_DN31064_c0_g1_i1.p1 TRINITY_DN31064_c0_g1~~TRINITY_DN31064_c0_g1_i1.p1  ORF type:complete len:780 (+),score=116.17 TRINITY_DN31064_c0_g1_i1:48-2387(+)
MCATALKVLINIACAQCALAAHALRRERQASRIFQRENRLEPKEREADSSLIDSRWENKIWCYYEYPNGPPVHVQLNFKTWKRHGPELEIIMVNDSNVKEFIPDLPEEYFMLPYASAKSDLLRAALLFHHGGLYMDTDYLVMRPLREFMSKLRENDIVVASDDETSPSQKCGKYFSSNFMAGRRHNGFSATWWENLKRKLAAKCPPGGFAREKVCCHEEGETDETKHKQCHIPWAAMEHMKDPSEAATALISLSTSVLTESQAASEAKLQTSSVSRLAPEFINELPKGLKLFCFQGNETLTPHMNGEIYWSPWNADEGRTANFQDNQLYDQRFACTAGGQVNQLHCTKGNWGESNRTFHNFFNRIAYHLFSSTGTRHASTVDEAFRNSWLVSELWRRSLGLGRQAVQEVASLIESEEPLRIWAYYEYPNGPSPFVKLNLETWRRHNPNVRIELVNDTNVRHWIPDLPEEYDRLGYQSAKSDVMRAALLYHHGGLYMDTDFMLMKPLGDIFEKLRHHDIVSYMDNNNVKSGECALNGFSSNFIAGKKGNDFSRIWWTNIKAKMAQVCTQENYDNPHGKICCHLQGDTPEQTKARNCNIPWASIEHLKDPHLAHSVLQLGPSSLLQTATLLEGRSSTSGHAVRVFSHLEPELIDQLPSSLSMFCVAGNESFVPHINGEIFWQPWDAQHGQTAARVESPGALKLYEQRFRCKTKRACGAQEDMECSLGNWGTEYRVMHDFFGRRAYHLFFSTTNKWATTKLDVLNMDWLLSDMYRRSLGLTD